jgi:3-deoxy-D-manno-octulosonate 8-phosphate phosphatase KdsC-like HAD superfamily phosphatase
MTPSSGGWGAAREALEALLDATGKWESVVARYAGTVRAGVAR